MERKSFELYVQAANWFGGLAAAGLAGVLITLLNAETPDSVFWSLKGMGILLLAAMGGAAYSQFHAIKLLNEKEARDEADGQRDKPATPIPVGTPELAAAEGAPADKKVKKPARATDAVSKSRGNLGFWQNVMFISLIVGSLALFVAVLAFKRSPAEAHWTVADVAGGNSDSLIVMSRDGGSELRILTRDTGAGGWRVESVSLKNEKLDVPKECAGKASEAGSGQPAALPPSPAPPPKDQQPASGTDPSKK